jgi:general stress protein YciG
MSNHNQSGSERSGSGNYANDPARASEDGKKGGQQSQGGSQHNEKSGGQQSQGGSHHNEKSGGQQSQGGSHNNEKSGGQHGDMDQKKGGESSHRGSSK